MFKFSIGHPKVSNLPVDAGEKYVDIEGIKNIQKELLSSVEAPDSDAYSKEIEINNLGKKLFDMLFSNELKKEYWKIRDKIKNIQIITDRNNWIPWEMVRPSRDEDEQPQDSDSYFLGEKYAIARWTMIPKVDTPTFKDRLKDLSLVIPVNKELPALQKLREYFDELKKNNNNIKISAPISNFTEVRDLLNNYNFDMIYFATHCSYNQNVDSFSEIRLGDGKLKPLHIEDIRFKQTYPIVIMNCCKSATQGFARYEIDGWMEAFYKAGASFFIGALWSIKQECSIAFTRKLFEELFNGETIGEAVRNARNYCREKGDPSWLAYVLFGEPNPRMTLGN